MTLNEDQRPHEMGVRDTPSPKTDVPVIQTAVSFEKAGDLVHDESESEEDSANPPKIGTSEVRRLQKEKLNTWIRDNGDLLIGGASKGRLSREPESSCEIIKESQTKVIIHAPRDYQIELFEKAKERNIIAVLDTGCGKTLIAILLLKYIIDQELEDRANGKAERISVFLVDSVTLLLQQFSVLECNLGQPIDRFCGDMGCDLWSKDIWQKHFEKNMVIACTADVLYQCLHRSFINIEQINLLIFDEAHHAKKNHAYARIIKDFYARIEDQKRLPKIFGMTASPVDAKVDVWKAASQLEGLLCCQIATASDALLLQTVTGQKRESAAKYASLNEPFETSLYSKIKAIHKRNRIVSRVLRFALDASSELGAWCADEVWKLVFGDEETLLRNPYYVAAAQQLSKTEDFDPEEIQEVAAIVKEHTFSSPEFSGDSLSSKVYALGHLLRSKYAEPTTGKCIVFVKERHTAVLLSDLFSRPNIGTPNLHTAALVGANASSGNSKFSFKDQVVTMSRFRKGIVNCLFATSVAEEGLDIPECNIVIRFELPTTVTQYIQSKGRARTSESQIFHMMEHGNQVQEKLITEVRAGAETLQTFSQMLPADRLLSQPEYNLEFFIDRDKDRQWYKETSTGAMLTSKVSMQVLAEFVSTLPRVAEGTDALMIPTYVMTSRHGDFICEVCLPETSPIKGALGFPKPSKGLARCSAAFEACMLLRKQGYLDDRFVSTYTKHLPLMRNAALALKAKMKKYTLRNKPKFWFQKVEGTESETRDSVYYLAVISFTNPEPTGRPYQPLGLVSRNPLPVLAQFPLFFTSEHQSNVKIVNCGSIGQVDITKIQGMNDFTLKVFKDIFSKEYQPDPDSIPYFLVPVYRADSVANTASVDWETLRAVLEVDSLPWEGQPDSFFKEKLLVHQVDGSFKVWAKGIDHSLRPLDSAPQGANPSNSRSNTMNKDGKETIMSYSSRFRSRKKRVTTEYGEDQPVIEGRILSLRRNFLDRSNILDDEEKRCFIIPEPMRISTLPAGLVTTAYKFPSIIYRIESCLIALEAFEHLDLRVTPELALEALTKDSNNTEEDNMEPINIQTGMGANYERLEFLGDCFLKMATSISLFTLVPQSNEFEYHVARMTMVCNKNLLDSALRKGLESYIRTQALNRQGIPHSLKMNIDIHRRTWYPEGPSLVKGVRPRSPKEQTLAPKTIADVCEAMIGASLLSPKVPGDVDMAVQAVTVMVEDERHNMKTYADYYKLYKKPAYQTGKQSAADLDLAAKINDVHAYTFHFSLLLQSAFTHGSVPSGYATVPSYERLEFLGDSLLDMACVNWLFHSYPGKDPQWLTEHKMAMVSNQFLAALSVKLGFHRHMRHFSAAIKKQTEDYIQDLTEALDTARQEAVDAGRSPNEYRLDYWVEIMRPPKYLADLVEAYVGAMFVDSEYNFKEVERFFDIHIKPFFHDISIYDTYANKHPLVLLRKRLVDDFECTQWKVLTEEVPAISKGIPAQVVAAVMLHDEIIAGEQDNAIRSAKTKVAERALRDLEGMSRASFKSTYGCNCKPRDKDESSQIENGAILTMSIGSMGIQRGNR